MTLDQLAIKHQTDKSSLHHDYCKVYEQWFEPIRNKPIKFVEIGFGGYEFPDRGGQGLRMWREYFTQAEVHCIELYDKVNIPAGCSFHQMSQDDERCKDICRGAHVICDDASHICPLTYRTFINLFPALKAGGLYIIEDIESSWCPHNGWAQGTDDSLDMITPTPVNIGRHLVNDINAQYIPGFIQTYPDAESVHFYKNLLVIKKK